MQADACKSALLMCLDGNGRLIQGGGVLGSAANLGWRSSTLHKSRAFRRYVEVVLATMEYGL